MCNFLCQVAKTEQQQQQVHPLEQQTEVINEIRMPVSLASIRLQVSKACFISLCLSSRAAGFVVQARARAPPSGALFATAPTSSASSSTSSSSAVQEGSDGAMSEGSSSYPRGNKPARKAETSKPKLWIYDHCPYCVRPR